MHVINRINTHLYSKFTLLFSSLIIFIILSPYADLSVIIKFILLFITMLVFVAVVFAIPQTLIYYVFFIGLALLVFVINCLYSLVDSNVYARLNFIGFIVFSMAAIYSFSTEIMSQKIITRDIIIGSVCIYLLIGIIYANLYALIDNIYPGSFQVVEFNSAPSHFEYLYFSFVTLTTVGYGDIVSTSIYSKPFVILETITGVFYVAILVARLVSAFAKQD